MEVAYLFLTTCFFYLNVWSFAQDQCLKLVKEVYSNKQPKSLKINLKTILEMMLYLLSFQLVLFLNV